MLFQWYLFVFLMVLYVFAKTANQQYKVYVAGEYEVRYKRFTALVIVAVLTYVAANRHENFIDTRSYIVNYMNSNFSWDRILQMLQGDGKDKVFYITTGLLRKLFGERYRLYLGTIAGFCLLCVFRVYGKHSCNLFMTTFLFLASGEYVMWTHNGIRQFMAVSLIFAATDLLLKKKYIPYILIVLVASTFHGSALIALPVILIVQGRAWNFKAIFMLLVILALTSSTNLLEQLLVGVMENSQYSNDVDAVMSTGGTNMFRVLVFCIPPLLALLFRRQITQLNAPLINLAVNMSVVSMGVYIISMFTSGIYIARLPIYFSLFNYMLLPWMIERFFEKNSAKLVYLAVIACYMGYYYYQMHVVWRAVTAL